MSMSMSTPKSNLAEIAADLTQRAAIGAEDVLALRRLVWGDAAVSRDEADALMALNAACRLQATEWVDYFVEVMVDYVVRQQAPQGYVDDAKAQWLMDWMDKDGKIRSLTELELLVKVLEVADSVPAGLRAYALRQIECAVLLGEGATRNGRHDGDGVLDANCINATEVALLRRIIFAQSGDGAYVVSRDEADMLFRVKDATRHAHNAEDWQELFVKAISNHLMAHRNYVALSRDDQVKLEAYQADTDVSLGRFFRRMVGAGSAALPPSALAIADQVNNDAAAADDQALTPAEIAWVISRIRDDGKYDPLEKALIALVRQEMASAQAES